MPCTQKRAKFGINSVNIAGDNASKAFGTLLTDIDKAIDLRGRTNGPAGRICIREKVLRRRERAAERIEPEVRNRFPFRPGLSEFSIGLSVPVRHPALSLARVPELASRLLRKGKESSSSHTFRSTSPA